MKQLTKLLALMLLVVAANAQSYEDPDINYTGLWKISDACKCAYSNVSGDRIDYSFSVDNVSTLFIIGEKLNTHGVAKITVDSNDYIVDLYSQVKKSPDTLHISTLSEGEHSISIEVTGEKNPSATNNQIVFKGFSIVSAESNSQPDNTEDVSPTAFKSFFSGKEYYSIIKDDTVFVFTNDSAKIVGKYSYDTKLMMDLRVISRNQNKLELWMIIGFSLMIVGFVIVLVRK